MCVLTDQMLRAVQFDPFVLLAVRRRRAVESAQHVHVDGASRRRALVSDGGLVVCARGAGRLRMQLQLVARVLALADGLVGTALTGGPHRAAIEAEFGQLRAARRGLADALSERNSAGRHPQSRRGRAGSRATQHTVAVGVAGRAAGALSGCAAVLSVAGPGAGCGGAVSGCGWGGDRERNRRR